MVRQTNAMLENYRYFFSVIEEKSELESFRLSFPSCYVLGNHDPHYLMLGEILFLYSFLSSRCYSRKTERICFYA